MSSTLASHLELFPARQNTLLNSGRYKILRKLGEGVSSSTWLVLDDQGETNYRYLAAKILTLDATVQHLAGEMHELEFLQEIVAQDDPNHLALLRDHFFEVGPRGRHLCLVMDLYSSSVASLRRTSPTKSLPPYMVRNIMHMTLEALVQIHALCIVHTDVKPDNLLLGNNYSDNDLERYLEDNPAQVDGEFEIDGLRYPIFMSQPVPTQYTYDTSTLEAERMLIYLNDFGHAQRAGKQPTASCFSAFSLRAPEVILWSDFGPGIDIWAVGCIAFELTVGRWLFHPEEDEDWSLEDDHLAEMMELTGQRFPEDMLSRSPHRQKYFDQDGNLLRIPELIPVNLEDAMKNCNVPGLSDEEISLAADFIRICLRFDYKERPKAEDLLRHPYFKNVFRC